MSDLPDFAQRLRDLRNAAKMTQQELADRAGIARVTVARMEIAEREPSWIMVQKLASALGVDCRAFLDPALQPPDAEPPRPRGRPRKDAAQGETPTAKKGRKGKG